MLLNEHYLLTISDQQKLIGIQHRPEDEEEGELIPEFMVDSLLQLYDSHELVSSNDEIAHYRFYQSEGSH